jgi:hypothetical protein
VFRIEFAGEAEVLPMTVSSTGEAYLRARSLLAHHCEDEPSATIRIIDLATGGTTEGIDCAYLAAFTYLNLDGCQ